MTPQIRAPHKMHEFESFITQRDQSAIQSILKSDERLLTAFAPDLNEQSRYCAHLVALTTQRVLFRAGLEAWKEIKLTSSLELLHSELAGVQTIELRDSQSVVASWRCTLGHAASAAAFRQVFAEWKSRGGALDGVMANCSFVADGAGGERKRSLFSSPLFRLLTFAKARMKAVILGFVLTLTATGVSLIPPYLTMPLVDEVLVPAQTGSPSVSSNGAFGRFVDSVAGQAPSMSKVAVYLGGLGLAAVIAWLLAWGQGFVLSRVSERISADLRNRAYAHLQKLSLEYFGDKRTGDLISRISNDSEHLCFFLSDSLVDFITDILMIIGSAVVLILLDPWLAVATLASFPIIASLILRVRGRLTNGFLRTGRAWSAMTNILADTIPGIRVVKAFAQEKREVERFAQANQRIFEINDRINALWTFFWPLVGLLNQAGLLIVWAVGAWEIFHHRVTVGVLTAFIAYIGRFYARLESMSRMLTVTQKASAGAQRLFEILDRVSTVVDPAVPKQLPQGNGALEFENISFRYGSRVVVDRVSFKVEAGEMVGIVGHTGSGKSSIANLACRFYDVTEGVIRIDGVDIRDLVLHDYRKNIGIVLQDPFLFFGSIADNISYGDPGASRGQILSAARVACAHEFILRLADGYDSLVGERGQALSGGERQRIAIARAVLIDPKILILDEATSAVDARTEREIQRALDNVVQGRTTIAIAHRLSTLRKANKLIVMGQGKLLEQGTHAELINASGEYARLYQAQMQSALGNANVDVTCDDSSELDEEVASPYEFADSGTPRFFADNRGQLWLELRSGRVHVHPVRCFPLTAPAEWIALVDERGREVVTIAELQQLSVEQRSILEQALNTREFIPRIESIERIDVLPSTGVWHVITDRGATEFTLGHEDHVRPLSPRRFVVTDTHGTRYLVGDMNKLDGRSRRLLSRYL